MEQESKGCLCRDCAGELEVLTYGLLLKSDGDTYARTVLFKCKNCGAAAEAKEYFAPIGYGEFQYSK